MKNQGSLSGKIKAMVLECAKSLLGFMGLVAVGGVVGTSCEEPAAMYGCPYSDFEIKGKVVDEQQKPIKGIVVTAYPELFLNDFMKPEEIDGRSFDAMTGEDGTFVMRLQNTIAPDSLYAVDVDGPENDGDFKMTGLKLELHEVDPPADRDSDYDRVWYDGAFESDDMLFEMKQKEGVDNGGNGDNGNEDIVWDFGPIIYRINLVDAEGNNLLDPECENAIDPTLIEADYKGVTYLVSDGDEPKTKEYLPHFYGLTIDEDALAASYGYGNGNYLLFGELEGGTSYENEELTLRIGEDREYLISFTREFMWADSYPDIHDEWYLNGEMDSDGIIRMVL